MAFRINAQHSNNCPSKGQMGMHKMVRHPPCEEAHDDRSKPANLSFGHKCCLRLHPDCARDELLAEPEGNVARDSWPALPCGRRTRRSETLGLVRISPVSHPRDHRTSERNRALPVLGRASRNFLPAKPQCSIAPQPRLPGFKTNSPLPSAGFFLRDRVVNSKVCGASLNNWAWTCSRLRLEHA